MSMKFNPRKFAVLVFAKSGAQLDGQEQLAHFERLQGMEPPGAAAVDVQFQVIGAMRPNSVGVIEPWLHLAAQTRLSLVCQRCLGLVEELVLFERDFRFVASEEQAQREDESSEEDVLVLANDFDLLELVEDELLMALPASPKHSVCPTPVKLHAADADYHETGEKPNPFASLAALKPPKS